MRRTEDERTYGYGIGKRGRHQDRRKDRGRAQVHQDRGGSAQQCGRLRIRGDREEQGPGRGVRAQGVPPQASPGPHQGNRPVQVQHAGVLCERQEEARPRQEVHRDLQDHLRGPREGRPDRALPPRVHRRVHRDPPGERRDQVRRPHRGLRGPRRRRDPHEGHRPRYRGRQGRRPRAPRPQQGGGQLRPGRRAHSHRPLHGRDRPAADGREYDPRGVRPCDQDGRRRLPRGLRPAEGRAEKALFQGPEGGDRR